MTDNSKHFHGYLCHDCAIEKGAKATADHVTAHMGYCGICGEERVLTHSSDYIWPGQKRTLAEWD